MPDLSKHRWFTPLFVLLGISLAAMILFFGREAVACATAGRSDQARNYLSALAALVALSAFFSTGFLQVRTQHLDATGITAWTLRRGTVTVPWSAVRRAEFSFGTAVLYTAAGRLRVGFAMYRQSRAAETFARSCLLANGVEVV